jgi:hypothetical protein
LLTLLQPQQGIATPSVSNSGLVFRPGKSFTRLSQVFRAGADGQKLTDNDFACARATSESSPQRKYVQSFLSIVLIAELRCHSKSILHGFIRVYQHGGSSPPSVALKRALTALLHIDNRTLESLHRNSGAKLMLLSDTTDS